MITKVQENRLRRVARRRGFVLVKSRQRDPRGLLYGKYMLIYASALPDKIVSATVRTGGPRWNTAEQIADYLQEPL